MSVQKRIQAAGDRIERRAAASLERAFVTMQSRVTVGLAFQRGDVRLAVAQLGQAWMEDALLPTAAILADALEKGVRIGEQENA